MTQNNWPIHPFILLCAAGIGCAAGLIALALDIPEEQATAIGLAACIECGLGLWLGARLAFAVTGALRGKHRSLADRIERAYARMGKELNGANPSRIKRNLKVELFMAVTIPVQAGALLAAMLGLAWAIEWQLDIHGAPHELLGIPALAALALTAAGISYQAGFLAWADRNLRTVEEKLGAQPPPAIAILLEELSTERYQARATSLVSRMARENELTKAA